MKSIIGTHVYLASRPGRFYVASDNFGKVHLVPEDGSADLYVDPSDVITAKELIDHLRNMRSKPSDFSEFQPFINHLLAHRNRVYFHVHGHEETKTRFFDRYLDVTGVNLEDSVYCLNGSEYAWKDYSVDIAFPDIPEGMNAPGAVYPSDKSRNIACATLSNLKLFWFLIEQHGFRINPAREETCASA